ncbi:rhodanese-related sulfurtransferase [Natronospira proteinivora]|uniref:Rhodanese-related sulfurtransferase n=1 Tax=Natronospira proteinivora TaxID=1807133 RepID=A0ABT1G8E4_9GAMM|nr:rhodanese-like domain-containing protein [Natronospira proteinivora]MCP1726578.1 rhodanese-related sulfurtransferase [Natronospira proteinivora]
MSLNTYDFDLARRFFEDRIAFTTGTHELSLLLDGEADSDSYQVLDVRFPEDYAKGHVPSAINLPMPKWENKRHIEKHLKKDATLYLYCYTATCHLAAQAALKLISLGYRVVEVEGGWEDWVEHGFSVETKVVES